MAETLVVAAIVVALLAVAIPTLIRVRLDLRQQELDSKAQTVYIAAQNQLVKLRSSGNSSKYSTVNDNAAKVFRLPGEPSDRAIDIDDEGQPVSAPPLYYISSEYREDTASAAYIVMQDMTADSELTGNSWIIEYIPGSGSVYAVFYSETTDLKQYYTEWDRFNDLRYRDSRISDGAKVGYYGGDSVGTSSTARLQPVINITNAETLTASFQCTRPSIATSGEDLIFYVILSDNEGHSYSTKYTCDGLNRLENVGRSYYVRITLDDLSSAATRFNRLYGTESGHGTKCLVPGTELTVTLTVSSPNKLIEPATVTATTNSLFSNDSNSHTSGSHNDTAVIEYARHLQNLDVLYDEIAEVYNNPYVVHAVQADSVSFRDEMSDIDWYSTYCGDENSFFHGKDDEGRAKFKPIALGPGFESFDGTGFVIDALNVEETGTAGLFADLRGMSGLVLRGVSLAGADIRGTSDAGAFAGRIGSSSNVAIADCRVYLDGTSGDLSKDHTFARISAACAGGLIGTVENSAAVNVTDSFASTVVRGGAANGGVAGGLVGDGIGSTTVTRSYADSYVHAFDVGGLVGKTGLTGNVRIYDSYAAGFLYPDESGSGAGLVNGWVGDMIRSYTLCEMEDELADYSGTPYYSTSMGVTASGNALSVYYFKPSSRAEFDHEGSAEISDRSSETLCALLGDKFTVDTSTTTHPYNLMGQTLSVYSYPRLKSNEHFGDWKAEFRTGALVYYEKYDINHVATYGFHGGNVTSTLTTAGTIVGDGYGIVYRAGDAHPDTLSVTIDSTPYVINLASGYYTVYGSDGVEYHVYPFPTSMLNAEITSGRFYQKVVVGDTASGDVSTYFYNPYFAKTVRTVPNDFGDEYDLADSDQIAVRSARHLYDLSLYHDVYADELDGKNVTFLQERDLSYSAYDWSHFYKSGVRLIDSQEPIGRTGAHHFKSNYNGQCYSIKDVSFISQSDDYVGLFGYNEGELRNIVVRTDYSAESDKNYLVQRVEDISINSYVSMGIIAGYNGANGIIYNCAAAGYYIAGSDGTIHAYSNSHIYIGGLVGINEGRIQNSASDCPTLRVSTLNAEGFIGGFVGSNNNSGMIYNCYALGHINVAFSRGGSVSVSGFAGANNGTISNSYCAVSLLSAGETSVTYAFAPIGGAVSNDYYLDRGTYTYINILHSYSSNRERTAGESCTRGELIDLRGRAKVDAAHTFNYPNTKAADQAYPYRGVVRDRAGSYVHYGDWQDDAVLGTLGVFYWEHEKNGANDGYHLTYIGTDEGLSDSGSTLCNEHDDGGIITEYGYGYYVKVGQEDEVTASVDKIFWSGRDVINTEAQRQLHMQMQDYTFYPFTTKTDMTGDYICLDGGMNDRDGKIALSFTNTASETTEYVYNISPFFANAISSSRSGKVTSSSGKVTDFSKPLGSSENPYEVRSIEQFQFINWNCDTKNCSTLVKGTRGSAGSGNYQKFPYLQYATVLDKGVQTRSAVEALRPPQFWLQTHDLHGSSGKTSTPIAGMATSTSVSNGSYRNILFAWFGGNYDGQSYKIQNVDVISDSYTVGLFGVVAGANIKNIILYGDGTNVVKRDTLIAGGQVGERVGAYQIGGLIGIAYEYKSSTISNKISNCAIAGYKVIDGSTNQQGAGTANVGGLIGLANINLDGCSSVVDVVLDCTHDNGHMCWGSYFRIGGLTGSAGAPGAQVYVRNCYTGGSISVTDRTLNERPTRFDGNGFALRDSGSVGYSSNLFISGMVGGSYAPNISNFSDNESNRPDGTANIENCYTYIRLPDLEGTIRSVSLFASQADRYNRASELRITNCYYLSSIAENIRHPDRNDPTTWPSYFFVSSKNLVSGGKAPTEAEWAILRDEDGTADPVQRAALIDKFKNLVISEEEFTAMLNGNLSCLKKYLNSQQDNPAAPLPSPATGIDFGALGDQSDTASNMAARLNSGTDVWTWVTVTEGMGAQIDGKFSFSSNPAQSGKNYPFPTVVTQKDLTYGTNVNVHYGEWPIDGVYWSEGLAGMDVFDDMQASGWAEKEFTLVDTKELLSGVEITPDSFTAFPTDIGQITAVDASDPSHIKVTLRAFRDGAVTVTELESGTQASFIANVTANLIISSEPGHVKNYAMTSSEALLTARSSNGTDYSDAGEWTVQENPIVEIEADPSQPNRITVRHDQPCAITPETTFRYVYNGRQYVFGGFLPIQTYGFIGVAPISSLNDSGQYSVATRVPSGSVTGEPGSYTSSNAPALPESTDGEFYVYEALSDESLYQIDINSITATFTDESSVEHVCVYTVNENGEGVAADGSEDLFEIVVSDPGLFDSDLNYNYLPCFIRYKGAGNAPEVSLEIVLTHGEDYIMSGEDKVYASYSFRIDFQTHNYLVSFDPNGGVGSTAPIRTPAGDITLPDCGYTRIGYSFVGWEDINGTLCHPGDGYMVNGDASFRALWSPISYTVVFDPAFTTDQTMAPMSFVYDEAQMLSANAFTRPGYIFMGWSVRSGGVVAYADAQAVMNLVDNEGETLTLYARWGAQFTLTLDPSGTSDPVQYFDVISGFTVSLEGYSEPARDGYVLVGWFTAAGDGIKILNGNSSIANAIPGYTTTNLFSLTEDRTLYAHWRKIPELILVPNTHEPGETPSRFVIPDGEVIYTLPGYAAPAEREGYIFDGWFTAENGGTLVMNADGAIAAAVAGYTAYDDAYHFDISEDKTLYGHWAEIPAIVLDPNAGDPADVPQRFIIGDGTVTELSGYAAPVRSGYVLEGWFTAASDGTKVLNADGTIAGALEGYTDGTYFTITETKTLYARWFKIRALILNDNLPGGSTTEYPIVGENVTVPDGYTAPEYDGCVLLGWFTEAVGGDPVLNADGTVAAAAAGYTDGTYITITEDKTLYGHWNVPTKVYLVSDGVTTEFNAGDFTASSAPAGYTAPSGLYSYGYNFEGWYGLNSSDEYVKVLKDWGALEAENVDGFVTDGVLRPGVTLYAKWTATVSSVDYTPDAADLALAGGWNKAIPNINWDLGDYIEVTMQLHKGTQLKQNVISFGLSWQDLYNFNKNQSAFHLTYPRNSNSNTVLRVTEMLAQKNVERFYGDGKYVTVRLSKDGLFLSNAYDAPGEELTFTEALHATDAAYNNNYHDLIENYLATGNGQMIFVGNIQGTQRSEATNYTITLVKPDRIIG